MRIQVFLIRTAYILTTWQNAMSCVDTQLWQQVWQSEIQ